LGSGGNTPEDKMRAESPTGIPLFRSARAAIGFLTILPIGKTMPGTPLGSLFFFPWVGLLLGGILLGQHLLLQPWLMPSVHALGLVLSGVILTRALHVDGLADSADALFSHKDPQRMLEIMKGSTLGTMGTLAVIFDVLLRWQLLHHLSPALIPALIVPPVLGRMVMGVGMIVFPYARSEGLARLFLAGIRRTDLGFVLLVGVLIACLAAGWAGLVLWSVVLLVAIAFCWWCTRRLGGYTGDTLGATNEITEILCLLLLLGMG
jgi:adenosylcobinamide-GDP ribazoletransferase